jgi:hypothetical protein
MQTRTYGDLFKLVQSFAGVTAFSDNEQDDIANLINRRYQSAYNTSQIWPRYLVTGQRRAISEFEVSGLASVSSGSPNGLYYQVGTFNDKPFYVKINPSTINDSKLFFYKDTSVNKWYFAIGDWNPTAGDVAQDVTNPAITFSTNNVLSIQNDTGNHNSPALANMSGIGFFGGDTFGYTGSVRTKSKQAVSYEGTENDIHHIESSRKLILDDDTIGEFIRIHRNKSFVNNSSLEYDFFVDKEGANILNIVNSVDTFAFVTYKKKFVPFTTSSDYTTSTEEVPGEFFQYIAYGTYADFLRMDGQHNKAQLEDQNAEFALAQQLERVDAIMNNNTINKKFSTYVNRQSR